MISLHHDLGPSAPSGSAHGVSSSVPAWSQCGAGKGQWAHPKTMPRAKQGLHTRWWDTGCSAPPQPHVSSFGYFRASCFPEASGFPAAGGTQAALGLSCPHVMAPALTCSHHMFFSLQMKLLEKWCRNNVQEITDGGCAPAHHSSAQGASARTSRSGFLLLKLPMEQPSPGRSAACCQDELHSSGAEQSPLQPFLPSPTALHLPPKHHGFTESLASAEVSKSAPPRLGCFWFFSGLLHVMPMRK